MIPTQVAKFFLAHKQHILHIHFCSRNIFKLNVAREWDQMSLVESPIKTNFERHYHKI